MILKQGCIQIYTGNGKGKTTASLGVVLRVLGVGGRVFYAQFIKGRVRSSEFNILAKFAPNFVHKMFGAGRFIKGEPSEEDKILAKNGLEECTEALSSGQFDIVVMDELNGALNCRLLEISDVVNVLKQKHKQTELIITGRNAPHELTDIADLVSEIAPVKHYFEAGIPCRKGIEF